MMGHSMGGATALMAGSTETRFKVIVALDPWMFPIKNESFDLITQPVITINTETLHSESNNKNKMFELMQPIAELPPTDPNDGPTPPLFRQAWTLTGSKHVQQCDMPFVASRLALAVSHFGLGIKRIDHMTVHDLTCYLSLDFIAKFLGKCHHNSGFCAVCGCTFISFVRLYFLATILIFTTSKLVSVNLYHDLLSYLSM